MDWQLWLIFAMIFTTFGFAALPYFAGLFFGVVATLVVLLLVLWYFKKENNAR